MKFGSVAIIGRSNVGKSTLLNRLLKEKIAIVSDKPQTTRTRILGVAHVEGAQIVFLDTPGFHEPHHLLNRRMVRTTLDTFDDADVLYVVVEATSQPGPGDLAVIDHVRQAVAKQPRPAERNGAEREEAQRGNRREVLVAQGETHEMAAEGDEHDDHDERRRVAAESHATTDRQRGGPDHSGQPFAGRPP